MAGETKTHSGGSWEVMGKKHYHRVEMIFEEGEMGLATYIIQTGAVELFKLEDGERVSLATLRAGELFGEAAILEDSVQAISARP